MTAERKRQVCAAESPVSPLADVGEALLRALREPNETHLGLSKGRSRGHALGNESAHDVWSALSRSEAAKSGLLKDLEDTVLMIEGISVDIVSDMTTNIIRGPLICRECPPVAQWLCASTTPSPTTRTMWSRSNATSAAVVVGCAPPSCSPSTGLISSCRTCCGRLRSARSGAEWTMAAGRSMRPQVGWTS
jgi:hypothetical protein